MQEELEQAEPQEQQEEEPAKPTPAERALWILGETAPPQPWPFPEPLYSHPNLPNLNLFERAYGTIQLCPKRQPAPAPRRAHPSSTHPGPVDPTTLGHGTQIAATLLGISVAVHKADAQQKDLSLWPPQELC